MIAEDAKFLGRWPCRYPQFWLGIAVSSQEQRFRRACPQWRGLKEFERRAGYVSALISALFATNQGIDIPRSPLVHAIGRGVGRGRIAVGSGSPHQAYC